MTGSVLLNPPVSCSATATESSAYRYFFFGFSVISWEGRDGRTEKRTDPSAEKYDIIPHAKPKFVAPKCADTIAGVRVNNAP